MTRILSTDLAEEWRPVAGWPDYAVSSEGRVASYKSGSFRELCRVPLFTRGAGGPSYLIVNLWASPQKKLRRVCVLVCEAFHGPRPSAAHQVAHSNGNSHDDRATNLRWATAKENAADRVAHGTAPIGERHPKAKLTEAAVREIRATPKLPGSARALARKFGVKDVCICHARSGRTWGHLS